MSRTKNAGRLVQLADGRKGVIYHSEAMINGKYAVHLLDDRYKPTGKNVLKSAEDLTVIGFTD